MANTWRPSTRKEVLAFVADELTRCDEAQVKFWEANQCDLWQAGIHRCGNREQVWVVLQHKGLVLYWEDVEDGFEWSALTPEGDIQDPSCNQAELQDVLPRQALT